ncbi:hypothetical protein [Cryobacterium roopkundense]|uniref:Uncharacterized protein n=1 Tax=Cryobacterium roopkundense TaxID=1001240 RepID=A0A7W9E2B2_9MICO|nr:hypothetical protein [Cryobacterium roopkundense]MBB5639893.1 hypothetical protein [Cryobacterium roopkundense]
MKRLLLPPTTESLTQAISAERTRRSAARWAASRAIFWPDAARSSQAGTPEQGADSDSAPNESPYPLA